MKAAKDLYQDILMTHNRAPQNMGLVENADGKAMVYNSLCGDEIEVSYKLREGKIFEIKFRGQGCAISRASASILTEKLKGKTVEQARQFIEGLRMKWQNPDSPLTESDRELASLEAIREYRGRIKCASLAWDAFEKALL